MLSSLKSYGFFSLHKDQPGDIEKKSQILHAVLYTHLLKNQLAKALDLVDELIIHSNVMTTHNLQLPQSKPGVEKPSLMTIVTDTLKSQVILNSLSQNQE